MKDEMEHNSIKNNRKEKNSNGFQVLCEWQEWVSLCCRKAIVKYCVDCAEWTLSAGGGFERQDAVNEERCICLLISFLAVGDAID